MVIVLYKSAYVSFYVQWIQTTYQFSFYNLAFNNLAFNGLFGYFQIVEASFQNLPRDPNNSRL
jgi:hypothetical protein